MAEISNIEEFETWLEDKPIEWSQVLAARVSLRVLPLIVVGFEKGKPFSEDQLKLILSSFRATCISWAARRYPAHDMRSAARSAADSARSAADSARSAAYSARSAARSAVYSADSAARSAADSARSAAYSAADSARSAADSARSAAIWASMNADCEKLLDYGSSNSAALSLITEDLWLVESERPSSSEWFSEALTSLEQAMYENGNNWHVWIEWYRPLLQGRPGWGLRPENAEKLVVRIAEQDEEFRRQEVGELNAKIAEWLADLRAVETAKHVNVRRVDLMKSGSSASENDGQHTGKAKAIQSTHFDYNQMALTSEMLRLEVDAFKEKLRGNNEINPNLRNEISTLLENHTKLAEEMVSAASEQQDSPSESNDRKNGNWTTKYLESVKNELPKYTDPDKFGKATIPAVIIGLSALLGSFVGMSLPFGLAALGVVGSGPLVKMAKGIVKTDGDGND